MYFICLLHVDEARDIAALVNEFLHRKHFMGHCLEHFVAHKNILLMCTYLCLYLALYKYIYARFGPLRSQA